MREMTDVQICRSKIAGDTRRKCEKKNIIKPGIMLGRAES
jgi:hypothetical protein